MPQDAYRKRRTREHVIADLSVNFVEKCGLQCGWTVQRFSPDYGLDLLLATFNRRGEIENCEVRLQLKATDSVRVVPHRQAIAVRLDWWDVVYWLNEWLPVILIVYDAKKRPCLVAVRAAEPAKTGAEIAASCAGDHDGIHLPE